LGKSKPLRERLWGAAVLKLSFMLRNNDGSPAYKGIYPGVLRDLELTDEQVDAFIAENREALEKAARGKVDEPEPGSA
jgi:hypothetical protein